MTYRKCDLAQYDLPAVGHGPHPNFRITKISILNASIIKFFNAKSF